MAGRKPKYAEWRKLVADVPAMSGVYEIWAEGVCLYVGQAVCMQRRLRNHNQQEACLGLGADLVRWTVIEKMTGARLLLERALTFEYRPKLMANRRVWPYFGERNWVEIFGYVPPHGYVVRTAWLEGPKNFQDVYQFMDEVWKKYA